MGKVNDYAEYQEYAKDVVEGNIVACDWIKLACKKYLDWFNDDRYEFRKDKADNVVKFIQSLRHYQNEFAGKKFILEPWQKWVLYNVFGFYHKGTNKRVIKKMLLFIARKNGKSFFGAAIALYLLIGERIRGTQVLNVANNRKQAGLLFTMEQKMVKSIDPKYKYFHVTRDTINYDRMDSYATTLASDASGLDGFGGQFICDESHEYKDSKLWDVLISGQGSIENPMAINLTTAGYNLSGYFLYDYTQVCKEILKGLKTDDTQFSAIYTLDEDDDWQDESVWVKANPNLGVTVKLEYLRDQVNNAVNNSSLEVGVKTKNLNLFCQSKDIWIPDKYILNATDDVNLEDFKDEDCFMGVDLSAVSDLTCTAIMFPPNPERKVYPDKYVFKSFVYLPETALEESMNSELYRYWKRKNILIVTSGNVVDYDYILNDQCKINEQTYLVNVAYDSWNATQWAINATDEGLPLAPYSQAVGNFNKPTKYLEMLIRKGMVVIDNNPIVRWSFNNVSLKFDAHDNAKPTKSGNDSSKKIDPVIAMIQALGGFLDNPRYSDGLVLTV